MVGRALIGKNIQAKEFHPIDCFPRKKVSPLALEDCFEYRGSISKFTDL